MLEVNANQWILPVILVVVVVFLMVMNFIRSRKYQQSAKQAADALKIGDRIVTRSGIFGTITELRETVCGKVATIEIGNKNNKSYMMVDVAAIYGVADDTTVVYDLEGNLINSETKEVLVKAPEKVEEKPTADVTQEKANDVEADQAKTETKETKKKTTSKEKANKEVAEKLDKSEKQSEPKKRGRKPKVENN